MKYLLVALVVMIAIGIWRNNRRKADDAPPPPPRRSKQRQVEQMVTCAHCGLHLPASDAVASKDQLHYCCSEHRRLGPQ